MSALLSRKDQAVSATDMARSMKDRLDRLEAGVQDHYVIMRNNAPSAVLVGADEFVQILDELEDLRMEITVIQRLAGMDKNTQLISHKDIFAKYK